ncbi:hypothetical protein JYK00_04775 [Thermosipho ferrireducens]|uniref:ABC-2 type transporter n=1 Tax=Thermosipho ferrireducens TaxID=2571116 RepID=A0ABX7S8A2_9BACT|nr:hypothetical protein [Thermosipho ferrireducens]QTA38824.1 hypothetical protein JYK00_04775 [Thermosipho ferrireducens]
MKYLNLFKGTLLRVIAEIKRYYLNTLSTFAVMILIFYFMVIGINRFGSPASLGNNLQGVAVGYFVWIALLGALVDLSWTIINEMSIGIIEQSFLSPLGPGVIYLFYQLSNFIFMMPLTLFMMVVIFKMAGLSILVPKEFFIILILLIFQGYGIGFILSGITLRFKRTQALLQIVQFAIISFLIASFDGIYKFLVPANAYVVAMRMTMNNKPIDSYYWIGMIVSTLAYLTIGMLIFSYYSNKVRKKGEIAVY